MFIQSNKKKTVSPNLNTTEKILKPNPAKIK